MGVYLKPLERGLNRMFTEFRSIHKLLTLLLVSLVPALPGAPLDSRVSGIINDGSGDYTFWGIYAVEADSDKVLVDINSKRLCVPASNKKLVSTALAAWRFSPDHRFETGIYTEGQIAGSVLRGDLIVKASGDPSWTPSLLKGRPGLSKLKEIATELHSAGITRIDGNLIVDFGRFREPHFFPPGWQWDDLDTSYGAIPSAFSINSNRAGVVIRPAEVGQKLQFESSLPIDVFRIVNRSSTLSGGSSPTINYNRSLDGDEITITGGIASSENQSVRSFPVGAPSLVAGKLLKAVLMQEGITVSGEVILDEDVDSDELIATVSGASIEDIVLECNRDSDNFLAESLYLLASADRYGKGSYRGAHQLEEEYWKKIGVNIAEFIAADGSGLSRKNAVSAHALVNLLEEMQDEEWWVDSLAVSGRSGTLRYRLSKNGMAGRVKAKTGTLDAVSALSGYIRKANGKTVIFSIMANNHPGANSPIRRRIDQVVEVLATY